MVTNTNKVTIGGSWLLLTLLMIGMSWSAAVSPVTDDLQTSGNDGAETADEVDLLALPETVDSPADNERFGYPASAELLGARTETAKTYIGEDGMYHTVVTTDPIHYQSEGVWEEINLNLEPTEDGWSVTENVFEVNFADEGPRGTEMIVDGQSIRIGVSPSVVVLDEETLSPHPYAAMPAHDQIDVGGNAIRYPMVTGVHIDYQVTSTQLKQNLVLRDIPQLPDHQKDSGYFGLAEMMYIPTGYALFLGESPIADGELVKTNQSLRIVHLDTGEELVTIAEPIVLELSEDGASEPYLGFYVIRVDGEQVMLTTVVDTTWLLDENRSYPITIDPTLNKNAQRAGYSYYYRYSSWWGTTTYERAYSTTSLIYTCRGTNSYYTACMSSSSYPFYYRYGWYRFDLNNALPTGATVNNAEFESHTSRYRSGARSFDVAVLKSGSSQSSNMIDPSSYLYSSGQYLTRYIRNSAASSSSTSLSDPGVYYSGSRGAIRSIDFNSNGVSDIQDAVDGNGAGSSGHIIGVGLRNTANAPYWYWCSTGTYSYFGCTGGTKTPHLEIDYSGGSDTTPPEDTIVPYTGLTTHRAEQRTFFFSLRDGTGVDTTSTNGPRIHYRIDNGSWSNAAASSTNTCLAGQWCDFKVSIPGVNEGDYVQYFYAFQDTNGAPGSGTTGNANFKTMPVGGTGSPGSITNAPSTPYSYFVQPVEEADDFNSDGTKNNKWQIKISKVNQYLYYRAYRFFDEQLTYYEDTQEYIWEYDTSDCGTGSNSCFNTGNAYQMRYSPSVNSYSYTNCAQVSTCKITDPGLTMNTQNGPGMSTIWWYNANAGEFAVVGLDTQTGIDENVVGTSVGTNGGGRNCDDCYSAVPIPGDITMKFGTLSVNATYTSSSSTRNWFCVNSNNHPLYFTSSSSSSPYCLYSYTTYQYDRQFNGWMAPGYDGRWTTGTDIQQKVSTVRPQPDIFPPMLDHGGLLDTHSEDDRTVTVGIQDAGDPPSGLNVSTGTDANGNLEGPHIKYRTYDTEAGTWSGWSTRAMAQQSDKTRAQCEFALCDWTATIPGTDRGNLVEYGITAQDNLNNWNNSTVRQYEIGTPTKVWTIEWHDQNCGFSYQYRCSWQAKFYDVTNEVEFHYDTGSNAYYDYQSIGYQKGGSSPLGETLKERGTGYAAGANPFDDNFRFATDGNTYGSETFSAGMTELYNYDDVLTGTSNGRPYGYYCQRYWAYYKNQCAKVVDMPTGFDFDYFGTTYSGNSSDTLHVNRFGAAAFSQSSSSTPMQMTYYYWYSQWPTMPNTGSYVRNVQLAPWYGYYASYYCYDNSASDCSIRQKLIPFDGAGMDVYADITTPTIWDNEMSPIRIVPSGDYIRVTADLTVEPGVEIQMAPGKGIDIAGSCNSLSITGNATHRNSVTNLGNGNGKGFAFTNGCTGTAGTDDRHTFEMVDFSNLDTAISAGSRHGNSPHYNGNVGNFTFDDVSFSDVGTAIKHGSGGGSGFDLSGVSMTNASNSCVNLPDDANLNWVSGSATNCNMQLGSGDGFVVTGDDSNVWIENVNVVDSGVNGVIGGATSLSLSNVSMSTSGLSGGALTGTSVGQTGGQSSGTDLYIYNVDASGYATGIDTHAVDDISIDTFSGGHITVAPGGTSANVLGATGWTMSDVTSAGNVIILRSNPESISGLAATGYLRFAGTAAASDQVTVDSPTAEGITIAGCGWNVRADDVTLGGSGGTWATAACTSSSARSTLTVAGGTMAGSSSNGNILYARNGKVTVAEVTITGQTSSGAYVASAGTNGDIRMIGVSWRGNDCADANGWTGMSTCWVDATSSSADIWVGGTAQIAAYRMIAGSPIYVADHAVTTTVVSSSGTCPGTACVVTDVTGVGTTYTDNTGNATAWLLQDRIGLSGGSTQVTDSYSDHRISVAGGAGQNETGPADLWYTTSCAGPGGDCPLPVSPGDQIYLKLEAFPQDWDGASKDCAWLSTNTTSSNGYYLYTLQLITLSTDLVIDGCKLHLNGTRMTVNRSATNNPTITITNGGELLISEGNTGEVGNLRALTSSYGWQMDIQSGTLTVDEGYLRDAHQDSSAGGALLVGSGATVNLLNGATVYGSPTVSSSMATIKVDGGTLNTNGANVYNAQSSGVGIHLEGTSTSNLQNVLVYGADTGIMVKNAAPAIDGFTVRNSTTGVEIDGGMTLPSFYRSTILSGESRGWSTHEIDVSGLASNYDYIQLGFNNIYMGGNAHPRYNYYTSRYFNIYDRMRVALDTGNGLTNFTVDAAGKQMTGYYDSGSTSNQGDASNPNHPSRNDGWARYDCNRYGYQYSPGGSYQYGYYWYFINSGGPYSSSGSYYGANAYPADFGFTLDKVDGLTGSQNYYPYSYWGFYWPSWYFGSGYQGGIFTPPEGFNGMWGYYNVCLSYAYRYGVNAPNGWRMSWPIVDTSSASIQGVSAFIDMVHNGADYYGDRLEFVFRGGNTINELMNADWGREFGKATIDNGVIEGAVTGIDVSGNYAAADVSGVSISAPTNEGVLISGSSSVSMDGVSVNGGRYGLRMTQSAAGALDMTNALFDGQSQDGVVLSRGIKLDLGGVISNATGAGVNVLSSSTGDWAFNSLVVKDSGVGLSHAGSGEVTCTDCTASGNAIDVSTSGQTTWIEGTVDVANGVEANGNGLFRRARLLDVTLTADSSAVSGAGVNLVDGNNMKVATEKTDANGLAADMMFFTQYVDSAGVTTVNLAGYRVLTAAKISYVQNSVADFRYALKGVTLSDAPGNSDSIALTDNFEARVCYSWSSSSYNVLATCSSLGSYGSRTVSNGNGGQITEYGYYQAIPQDLSNKAVMIDTPFTYSGSNGVTFNGSNVFFTGSYSNGYSNFYVSYPYTGYLYAHNSFMAAVGPEGTEYGRLGYYGGYNYGNFDIDNSTFVNWGSIGTGAGYYNSEPVLRVVNSTMSGYNTHNDRNTQGGVYYEWIGISGAGSYIGADGKSNFLIEGNTIYNKAVCVFLAYNYYAFSTYYGGNGTDSAEWKDNECHDAEYLPYWVYLYSYADDLLIDGNTVEGGISTGYGVYTQDSTVNSIEISNNVIKTADNPIYLRGTGTGTGTDYNIHDNTIYGPGDSSYAGIYVRNGHGDITDNTLINADGGINVYGILSGYNINIDGNSIGTSGGRIAPTAVGIFVENCGLRTVYTSDNSISTTANALVSDGCDVEDTNSTFTSAGGSASQIHTVNVEADAFNAQVKNITTGDTIRWRATEYNSDPNNYIHSTTSNDSLWDSGQMNLGSTFTYTFNTAGSYYYHCNFHSWMWGVVNVANSTGGNNLQTLAIDVIGGNEDITLSGTAVSGYSQGIVMDGGSLTLSGDAVITGDNPVAVTATDVTVDGATLNADSGMGTALSATSSSAGSTFDATDLSVSGATGVSVNGHTDFRWNGGTSTASTTLATLGAASGSIENMSWSTTTTQVNAGAYSIVTSVGNTIDQNKLTIGNSAVVHEGNLLDLEVLHMGASASNVGLMIKSTDNGRSEYVSPSWRQNIISVGEGPGGAAAITDWFVSHPYGILNIADDAMPGAVAINPDPTSQAMGFMTWDNYNLYIMLTGVTFTLTDGMWYLDTVPGGSTTGDNWYVSHNLPFAADYMLWAEDLNNWGIRKVMPGGNWVDTTSSCSGMQAAPGFGIPGVTATFSGISEFAIPWSCIGSPTSLVKTLAVVQNENSGHVLGVYPPQYWNQSSGAAQTFGDFGTLQLQGSDLADGTLESFLLIHRTFTQTGATSPRAYDITVKVRDADNIYWDWGAEEAVSMATAQDITIDIMRAKPVIQDLVDVTYDEDTGAHTLTLTNNAQDYQQASNTLAWSVTNDPTNPSNASSPFTYGLDVASQQLTLTTEANEFGNHRLYLTVRDGHGLFSSQSMLVNVDNVNDAPVIENTGRTDGVPVFFEDTVNGVINVYDEPQRRDPVTGNELTWDLIRKDLGSQNGAGFIVDLANEQDASAPNNAEQAPQTYTWTARTSPADCTPFSVSVIANTLEIDLNEDNEAGGTCDIILNLTDGASVNAFAAEVSVPFTLNPVNDAPVIYDWNVTNGHYIDVANGTRMTDTTSIHTPWYWMVMEDDENANNLTIDLTRMLTDNDHTDAQLTWSVENLQNQCNYENYFSITIDNDADTLEIDLIDDATTDTDSSQWDMLQDADGDGVPDGGIHQMMPPSGTYCTVKVWLHDTVSAPPQYDYSQSSTGQYVQKSDFEYLNIRVHNIEEARPDYSFNENYMSNGDAFDFHNIDGVLAGTSVPVTVQVQHDGDLPPYNYDHDVLVSYYVDGVYQDSVRLGSNGPGSGDAGLPGWGGTSDVTGWVTLNQTSQDVRVFVDVLTVNPFTGQYVTDNIRRPALEELNWDNNNMTTLETNTELPMIVETRPPASVASFAPTLMAISLVGAFVGLLLGRANRDRDEEEFEEQSLIDDDEAVSPVIATILLVAITVVLAGVIYVWAGSLADTSTKGVPRMTFQAEANADATEDQDTWNWMIKTTYAATDLATQAVHVSVEWTNSSGNQFYKTSLAPPGGDVDHVYGFSPSNSPNMVTVWDDISHCTRGSVCITTFGAGDRVYVRMTDDDGLINSASIQLTYELPGGDAYVLKTYSASPTSIR